MGSDVGPALKHGSLSGDAEWSPTSSFSSRSPDSFLFWVIPTPVGEEQPVHLWEETYAHAFQACQHHLSLMLLPSGLGSGRRLTNAHSFPTCFLSIPVVSH